MKFHSYKKYMHTNIVKLISFNTCMFIEENNIELYVGMFSFYCSCVPTLDFIHVQICLQRNQFKRNNQSYLYVFAKYFIYGREILIFYTTYVQDISRYILVGIHFTNKYRNTICNTYFKCANNKLKCIVKCWTRKS